MPLSHSKQMACDNVMGQNSYQPEGLQPESALAALLVLRIHQVFASPGALPSPILAATHTCFMLLRTHGGFLQFELDIVELGVDAAFFQQFAMTADFGDAASVKHHNARGFFY